MAEDSDVRIVPANEASWDDLQAVLTGTAQRCQCQRQRLGDRVWWRMPVTARAALLRDETACGDPDAERTIGILAYQGDEAVGWCAVDRRSVYRRLRGSPVPWKGRTEDKDDDDVWAIACIVVRRGHRRQGLTYPLVAGAVVHARARGAKAIEGYPLETNGKEVIWDEMSVGPLGPFLAAGFREVAHPTLRRRVVRLDFS
jgi:hypothetical protein